MNVIELIKNDTDNSYLPKLLENDYYPMVSVVTPTFNRDHLFDIAVFNWKNFIYPADKMEWIILDDSSRDSIKKLKKKLPRDDSRIKYYTCKKINTIGKKRNKANELATGEIIVHMDDDDYYPPDSIINRVRALLTYSKQCVGCSGINCINLLDNTCFKTNGGLKDNTIIAGEASFCYYKKFWQDQRYDEDVMGEECKAFLENRTNDYIDLHSAFVMVAITHSKNMSDRVIKDSINRFNFFNDLPVSVVNLLETLQIRIHEGLEGMSEAKDFVRQHYGKPYKEILQKIDRLPNYVKSTSLMSSYIEDIQPVEDIKDDSVIATYFPGIYYRTISYVNKNNFNYRILQIINYLNDYHSGRSIRLYVWTDEKFNVNNIEFIPWYYFNKKVASDYTVVFDEYSHVANIHNSNHITYVNLSNEDIVHSEEFLKKINNYDTFGNKNYIFKTAKLTKALPINNLKYYYLGLGTELSNNKIFTETHYNELFINYTEIHSYSYCRFDKEQSVLPDDDINCEFFVLKKLNIPLMCYLLKLGIKYLRIDEEDLKEFGILSIYDNLPPNYLKLLDEKLKTVIKIM